MRLATLSEHEIIITLIALALLLLAAFVFGSLMELIKGPRVVGEILGGMILGGSCLFLLLPGMSEKIFFAYAEEGKVLNIFYQLGLIFLMFLSGYNTDIKMDKSNAKTISLVFVGATFLPMLGSIPFFGMFEEYFKGPAGNEVSYKLVFAIGVAITSIPVISKIFFDMGIMNKAFSNTVLTVSTFQDLCLWILLNVATRIAQSGEIKLVEMIVIVIVTIGIFVAIAIISKFIKQVKNQWKANTFYSISFAVLMFTCGLLYMIGINIMYSAFVVGYLIKAIFGTEETVKTRMHFLENIAFSFFIPIYFALVGIQLNVIHDFSIARFALFFAIAFGLEFVGTFVLLMFSGLKMSTRMNFAITMNARGGPGIVLATVAYSYEIISLEFFTVLILTTMVSSMIAGYYLRLQQKRDAKVFDEL
ncbi:MAG: cation:proton antiporter [Lachnospiraceae bacterium]|nr:cation:proton antiporter [Lachnospiraceae bacterium]